MAINNARMGPMVEDRIGRVLRPGRLPSMVREIH